MGLIRSDLKVGDAFRHPYDIAYYIVINDRECMVIIGNGRTTRYTPPGSPVIQVDLFATLKIYNIPTIPDWMLPYVGMDFEWEDCINGV